MAKTIEVEIQFTDRSTGPGTVGGKARVEAGGLAAGVGKAVREILGKQMDRKQRFDAVKNGIVITAKVLGDAVAEAKEATA
jgi:nitrogenase subunit NifH